MEFVDENLHSLTQEYILSPEIEKNKIIKKLNLLMDNDELVKIIKKNNADMQTIINDN